ncbi:MAG: hypothetical protein M1835_004888 [Candelina submexicana]|nr:MAG: hypothetical protein M1835_004888 [Candelina submexicana]
MRRLHSLILSFVVLLTFCSAYTTLSDDTLRNLPASGNDFDIHDGVLLAPILRPRVPGTPGSTAVLKHFVDFFKTELPEWTIEFQNSTSKTPATGDSEIPFINLIVTRDPPWTQPGEVGRLALVAHYDSKLTPAGFIGATDSAAPCAMLMHAAKSVDAALTRKWGAMTADGMDKDRFAGLDEEKGVQIILLDGEEAFVSWSDSDSLYGARALADAWEQKRHPALSTFQTAISSISLFLLLDLLGAADPKVPSYFKTTHWAYQNMAKLETRLRSLQQFKSSPNHPSKHANQPSNKQVNRPRDEPLFLPEAEKGDSDFRGWMVQDDHIPFMARGVEVLHMIPTPFPRVWHEMTDDGEHLDTATVVDWATLVTAFLAEWMDLEGYFETPLAEKRQYEDHTTGHENKRRRTHPGKTEL